jgi:amino acid adenylation domain-containing protein
MLFSVLADLEHSANIRGEKIAIVDGEISTDFISLREQAKKTAQALISIGVKSGDRVGICMTKSTNQISCILATLYANAIFVPILPALKYDNIAHIVTDSGMRLIITDDRRFSEIVAFESQVTIAIGDGTFSTSYPNLNYLSRHTENHASSFKRIGKDIAAIIYSSGSTGRPKGIMVTHRNLSDGARIVSSYLGTNEDDRIASILSFNFDYGLNQIFQSLLTGASIHLHEFIMPNDCMRFLSRQKITALPLMPAIMTRLFDRRFLSDEAALDLSHVRYVCSSGGRVSLDMLSQVRNIFSDAKFYSMYGLTEAFRSTYLPPEVILDRPNSIGKAIPDVEILVLDGEGNECQPGVVGELVHRGGCVTRGYWNDEVKTAERFRTHPRYPGEILVYSGDLVVKDTEGYLTFVNRIDGMLKNNGIRISPTEIEDIIERHPNVTAAVVFGLENIEVGHDIVGCYTTDGSGQLLEKSLRQFLKLNLPNHMVPKHLVQFDNFPITGNQGKVDRVSVREQGMKALGI